MRTQPLRWTAFACGLAAGVAVLLLALARPGDDAPWHPAEVRELPLSDFASPTARIALREAGLHFEAPAPGMAELVHAVDGFDAERYRFVAYSFQDLPVANRLLLTWQGEHGRGFTALPDPVGAGGHFDLGRVPGWKGRIEVVGLALVPTDYAAAEVLPAPSLSLLRLELESSSWRGALSALLTEWTAYRGWTGRSINTSGFDFGSRKTSSLTAFVALAGVLVLVLLRLSFGAGALRRAAMPVIVACAALLVFEQMRQHALRVAVAAQAAAGASADPSRPLAAHPPLAMDSTALLAQLHRDGLRLRTWVHGPGGFFSEYPVWLLREQDAGLIESPDGLPSNESMPDSLLVLVGRGDWSFDAATSRLSVGNRTLSAQRYFEGQGLVAYRLQAGVSAP
jgi:hypothetical protein